MSLFNWFKKDPAAKGMVPGRAVAIPHHPRVEGAHSSVENFSNPTSVSTLGVTVRLLQPGESAVAVGSKYERLPPGTHRTTNLPDGCQRLHVNVPNWVHLMVRQEGYVHKEHTEIPVWVNSKTGKIDCIDKDKLVEELEPERERAIRIYEEAGIHGKTADMAGPESQSDLGGMIGGLLQGASHSIHNAAYAGSGAASTPEADNGFAPDLSQYPPIEGVDFYTWVLISAQLTLNRVPPAGYDEFAQSKGAPAGRWPEIDSAWNQRIMSDWKLGALKGSEYERQVRGG